MNILFVSTEYVEPGMPTTGMPNYIRRTALMLRSLGHLPAVLYSTNYSQHRMDEGVEVFAVRVPYACSIHDDASRKRRMALLQGYYANRKLSELLRDKHYDIIQFSSIGGISLFYEGKIPAVMRLSSYAKIYFPSGLIHGEETVEMYTELEQLACRTVDRVYAPSFLLAGAYGRDVGLPVDVLESPFFNDAPDMDEDFYKRELSGKRYALFFGTLFAEKGIFVIAEILRLFLESHPEFYFVAIGENTELSGHNAREALYGKAGSCADRVRVYSPLPHKALYPVICHADFVVLPSLVDNFPNACMEAMYFGKVVIGTRGSSFEQMIEDGNNGLLCVPGSEESLLAKMSEAASIPLGEKEKMGERARTRIGQLSPNCAVQKLVQYYEKIIRDRDVNFSGNGNARVPGARDAALLRLKEETRHWVEDRQQELAAYVFKEADKRFLQSRLLMSWLFLKERGIPLDAWMLKRGYQRVAVYGLADLGMRLIGDLEGSHVTVVYGVDQRVISIPGIPTYTIKESLPRIDAVIVTSISYFDEVRQELLAKVDADIVSLEEVIYQS